jgi:hypothetical protein
MSVVHISDAFALTPFAGWRMNVGSPPFQVLFRSHSLKDREHEDR